MMELVTGDPIEVIKRQQARIKELEAALDKVPELAGKEAAR
jgi:hypothetical protein